jgi:hypothetical protein
MNLNQDFLSMREAAKRLPTRPHISTVIRWAERGCRGIRLKTWLIGGVRVTSEQALSEFLSGLNGERVEITRATAERLNAAEKALDEAGI